MNAASVVIANGHQLDPGQSASVAAMAGSAALLVIEGAAGAGKTTLLAAAREQLDRQAHRLVVVTPTLKAAKAATDEIGAPAGSAAWLAHQHGWRWDETGSWTRLAPSEVDPVTGRVYQGPNEEVHLRRGDVALVDEAGMLGQDTAHALLTIADETGARVALIGDRHQLPAVGRGGVLDLARRWADPQACVTLDVVHRFTREATTASGERTRELDHIYAGLDAADAARREPGRAVRRAEAPWADRRTRERARAARRDCRQTGSRSAAGSCTDKATSTSGSMPSAGPRHRRLTRPS